MDYVSIYNLAVKLNCRTFCDEPMSKHTSFRIGGKAKLMIIPSSVESLCSILSECDKNNIKPLILGNGSNMLICDGILNRVVINMSFLSSNIRLIDSETVECDAGVPLSKLCKFALEQSLSGLEFAFGIPGSAGGAAFMNAGAYGGEMKDVLKSCTAISPKGEIKVFNEDELDLSYRHSIFSNNNYTIIKIKCKLSDGNYDSIKLRMDELIGKRKSKQPLEYPSAGSVFKRPEGNFAGTLIEQCGLKGKKVGGAEVSKKHAGFIINVGSATAEDVIELINFIQKTVLEKTGIRLEPEIRLVN